MWNLRNANGTVELGDLSTRQLYALYLGFSPQARGEWVVSEVSSKAWQTLGELNWRQLLEEASLLDEAAHLRPSPPVIRGSSLTKADDLEVEMTRVSPNARQHRRFAKNLIFVLTHRGKNYEFLTADVSLGGLHLETPLPPGLPRSIDARLVRNNREWIEVSCSVIRNSPTDGCHLRIERISNRDLLNQWLIQM